MIERSGNRTSLHAVARANVARQGRRARAGLWVEAVIGAFWPLWTVLVLGLGLALLGVPASLPATWHYVLLGLFAVAAVVLAIDGARRLRGPNREQTLERLDSGAIGRPAQTFDDPLAAGAGDKGSEALWAAHQRRLAERAAALKAPALDLRASQHDGYALRHGALVVLAAGCMAYFGADATRLSEQFVPAEPVVAGPPPIVASLEAWATPPLYTGAAPVYLTRLLEITDETGEDDIVLHEGTEVSLRVFDTEVPPTLEQTVNGEVVLFEDRGAQVYDAVFPITESGEIIVRLGEKIMGAWDIAIQLDEPPTIHFHEKPTAGVRGAMVLEYRAFDDYGVRVADAKIELDPDAEPPVKGTIRPSLYEPIELQLPLPLTGDSISVAETLTEDLSEHPWVGLPVIITIRAIDAAGQEATAVERMDLPGRIFLHATARSLLEQRRDLAFSPDAAPRVLDVLGAVMNWPDEVFDDTAGYLAASMARRRLGYSLEDGRLEDDLKSIVDLLWKAAIRLEDGDLSSAAERLARAQERLREAIENGASEDEISQLMQELREAMRDYMAEMAREALRDQANGQQQQQQQQQGQQLTQQDLEQMLQQLEEAMRNGQQELARQLLQQLQQMMNNLQMAQPGQGQPGQGEQMMNQMGEMIGDQSDLADRSFDQMRQGQQQGRQQGGGEQDGMEGEQSQSQGGNPRDNAGQIARDQEALQRLLDELRGNLPGSAGEETRRALDEADRAMGDAVDSLENGDTRGAVDDQVRALDALREGRQQLGQDLAQAEGRQGDQAGRDGPGGDAEREDPLGRPRASDGPLEGRSTDVPGASLGKRARELQEEIRRRSGERQRPAEELDYLERLLDRF
ncbi:MAG: TIGR02302 family protein [Pseudomonadota bacterium]